MKKYFFLVSLMMVVFLWLGSVTNGQNNNSTASYQWTQGQWGTPTQTQWGTVWWSADLQCSEIDNDRTTLADGLSDCPAWSIVVWQDESWKRCCWPITSSPTTNTNTSTTTTNNWQPCTPPNDLWGNSHVNSITQQCVCNDGWTKINNVCMSCKAPWVCCGIKLNTSVPFIGNCIESKEQNPNSNVTDETAFPVLMWSLTKILVTVILIISFVLIIVGGIMIATGDPSGGKKMIMKVVIGIALLGASGVILRLINPNFFG